MLDTIDPAVANEWIAVGTVRRLGADAPLKPRIFGREVCLTRAADGSVRAAAPAAPDAPVHVAEHCGYLWICLGAAPRPLFALPEFDEPGRRFIDMGAIGLHTGPLRVVENFLDMAHFPYVHTHYLGAEPITEVREHTVELREDVGELWAHGCKFVQPRATAASTEASDVDYTYRVVNPYSPILYKAGGEQADHQDIIFLFVQPVDEEECIAHYGIALYDSVNSDAQITAFQHHILGQDKPILENHLFKRIPLDAKTEVPARADATSTAYRRWLRGIGLRHGVLAAS